jgi:hypothetical protein
MADACVENVLLQSTAVDLQLYIRSRYYSCSSRILVLLLVLVLLNNLAAHAHVRAMKMTNEPMLHLWGIG